MWWTRAPCRMPFSHQPHLEPTIFLTHSCSWIQFTWLNHVAVTGTATAAPAKRVDAGSSPARNSSSHISDTPGWQMRSLHPTENREEHARYVPQAPFRRQHKSIYGDSTRVQMILARSSRPERYRLSPPIAGCHLASGSGQRARSKTG